MSQNYSLTRAALTTSLPLELSYSEHECECMRGLSPELAMLIGNVLAPREDQFAPQLCDRQWL